MMMSERPNSPRGRARLTRPLGRKSGDTVGNEDVAHATHGLQIKRQFGIFLDLAAQSRDLDVDGALQRYTQPRAQIAARKSPSGICGEKLEQGSLRTRQLNGPPLAA